MIIDFYSMDETVIPNFKGGEKEARLCMHVDEKNKIMRGVLETGASIGMHTHETSSEIIFFIQGNGKMITDGKEERISAGLCHYCPKGHTHTMINDGTQPLVFFAVVPEQ